MVKNERVIAETYGTTHHRQGLTPLLEGIK